MGEVKFNLDTNIKQKTAELKEGAMAMRQVASEAQKADRQAVKNTKTTRAQVGEKKKLIKSDKELSIAERKLARETERSLRNADKSARAHKRAAKAAEGRRTKLELLNASLKRSSMRMAEQQKFNSLGGRFGRVAGRGGRAIGRGAKRVGQGAVLATAASAVKGITDTADETERFTQAITPLLALGDNLDNIEKVMKRIDDVSLETGLDADKVADAMFVLESATAGLSKTIQGSLLQDSIELAKVNREELEPSVLAMAKSYNIFKDQVRDTTELQNILQTVTEDGINNFGDIARLFPDVGASAKALGIDIKEVAAAIVVATKVGGDVSKTYTGVRNVFSRMRKAEEQGIKLTGSLVERFQQLSKVDVTKLQDIFGDEAFTVVANITSDVDGYRKSLEKLKGLKGDIVLGKLIKRREKDPFFRESERKAANKQITSKQQRDIFITEFSNNAGSFFDAFKIFAARASTLDFEGAGNVGAEREFLRKQIEISRETERIISTPGIADDVKAAAGLESIKEKVGELPEPMVRALDRLNRSIEIFNGNQSSGDKTQKDLALTVGKIKGKNNQTSEVRN